MDSLTSQSTEMKWEFSIQDVKIGKYLASGGEGKVHEAKFQGELVAVKIVKKAEQTDIEHLRRLCHPNVIRFFGVCRKAPIFYVIMELCPNGSLFGIIHDRDVMLCPRTVASWLKQIAQGMEYLHEQDVLHCDLKSPNILIGKRNEAKISDFGSSQVIGATDMYTKVACTARWMAPELIRGKVHTYETDVWAYGVVAWELLMRQVPYKQLEKKQVLYRLANYKLALPLPRSMPTTLRQLIIRCQDVNVHLRPMFDEVVSLVDAATEDLEDISREDLFMAQLQWQNSC